jgi:hypothetical protein
MGTVTAATGVAQIFNEPGQSTPMRRGARCVIMFITRPADVPASMPAIAWRSGTGPVVWDDFA